MEPALEAITLELDGPAAVWPHEVTVEANQAGI